MPAMSVLCNKAIGLIDRHSPIDSIDSIDILLYVLAHSGASDVAEAFDIKILGIEPPRDWNEYSLDDHGLIRDKEFDKCGRLIRDKRFDI